VQKSVSLAALIGKSVPITFTGVEDGSKPTLFVIDDVAVNVAQGGRLSYAVEGPVWLLGQIDVNHVARFHRPAA
jgi:hypothetical protein